MGMNLDDMKNEWQKKQAPDRLDAAKTDSLFSRYLNVNKKMVRSNWISTIFMCFVMLFIVWIWWLYEANQGWAFDGSIISTEILIAMVLAVMWSRTIQESRVSLIDDTQSFLKDAIAKLKRTITITKKVMPVYAILLNLSLVLYFYDLMKHKPSWFLIATVLTTVYNQGMAYIGFRRHRKKQKNEVEPLIEEMQEMLTSLNSDSSSL